MTLKKWDDINFEACNKYEQEVFQMKHVTPENWDTAKAIVLAYVKTMDEATEVYNLENKVK
jgi:hypothetical protein